MEKTRNLLSNTSEWGALLRNSSKLGRIAPVRLALEKSLVINRGWESDGPIWPTWWRGHRIAWDTGIKLYDCASQMRFAHIDRPPESLRADLSHCWQDDVTPLVGWVGTITVIGLRPRPGSISSSMGGLGGGHGNLPPADCGGVSRDQGRLHDCGGQALSRSRSRGSYLLFLSRPIMQIGMLEGCKQVLGTDCTEFAKRLLHGEEKGFFLSGKYNYFASRCRFTLVLSGCYAMPCLWRSVLPRPTERRSIFLCQHVVHAHCASGAEGLPWQLTTLLSGFPVAFRLLSGFGVNDRRSASAKIALYVISIRPDSTCTELPPSVAMVRARIDQGRPVCHLGPTQAFLRLDPEYHWINLTPGSSTGDVSLISKYSREALPTSCPAHKYLAT